ncbi:hypothetical protein AS026_30925 [Rhizobium altiplani]|uniref:DUF2177 family protein n=1 Tax=Rhizobium altiplani TaxID=1864509 RepID=A0A109JYY7_9HYPH|nr:DUF2177 family protein [Rhizobium altiplani]KWV57716.1 hypothetical protein AS026_30925 [Rhizobium altiplani]
MMNLICYIATALVFLGLDVLWLTRISPAFYRSRIGELLLAQPNFAAAAAFYLIYVAGIVYFAVVPALNAESWSTALVSGAILGLVAFGTYDMTNLATLKGWSLGVSLVDMSWGMVITASSATAGYLVTMHGFLPWRP